jgi:hypothetical protein
MLEVIRQHLRRKPFSPFRIVMKSGERHEVVYPEKIAIGKDQVFLVEQPATRMASLREADIELVFEPRRRMRG